MQSPAAEMALAQSDSSLRVMALPLVFIIALGLTSLTGRVQSNPVLLWSVWGSTAFLALWFGVLALQISSSSQRRILEILLRPQHYVQAMVQSSVYLYWGYHWQPVYDHFWLMVAQLAFAYSFDMLLSWSRRSSYIFGFGSFPIVFSINLFLWFRDDWFYMQFVMLAVGILGKEFVRWQREGKYVHIFNPSAFALGLFSVVLIATNTSGLTWGQEIASTLTLAPNIYTFLFLIGLVVMYFFRITLVAGTAAIVLLGLSAIYSATAGVPYFLDSEIPAAVFLGLHLLVTDPSTSPRTPLGKTLFGALYGLGVFGLYTLLGAIGAPTFYDKLLCVPLLNLSVIAIDRYVKTINTQGLINLWRDGVIPLAPNVAHMVIWVMVFGTASVLGKMDGRHTGDSLPFWQQSCTDGLPNACRRLVQLEATYCGDNSAWACNELGIHYQEGRITTGNPTLALDFFAKACELKFQAGCVNLLQPASLVRDAPRELDLRLLLREGGLNLMEMPPEQLYARACEHGWDFACNQLVASR
ncbi:MAG: hypothetical protein RLZZ385_2797 [Pseudomonadota bacterium]|jgi:hypothetical protein